MNRNQINIIVFTGIDGSGKSTLINNLQKELDLYEGVQLLRCPSYHELPGNGVDELSVLFQQINNIGNDHNQNDIKALGLFLQMSLYRAAIQHKSTIPGTTTIISERHPVIDTAVYGSLYAAKVEGKIQRSLWQPVLEKILDKSVNQGYNKVETWLKTFCNNINIDATLWNFTGYMKEMLIVNNDLRLKNLENIFSINLPDRCYFIDIEPGVAFQRIVRNKKVLELHETLVVLSKLRQLYLDLFKTINQGYPTCVTSVVQNIDYLKLKSTLSSYGITK